MDGVIYCESTTISFSVYLHPLAYRQTKLRPDKLLEQNIKIKIKIDQETHTYFILP